MDAVDEIKQRINLVDFIGRSVALKRSGRNFSGLCPFHQERTPSFYVFQETGTWRCFGQCGEGGDVFSFVEKRDGIDFRQALDLLGREAGVEITRGGGERRRRGEHLSAIVEASAAFYTTLLESNAGAAAREYLDGRQIEAEARTQFRLGWAPDEWRHLVDHLAGLGYEIEDMIAAGVAIEREGYAKPYDRFRGRITFPIADERGALVGMGARSLDGSEPKYLNTPQSELFDKGRTLYGLELARDHIREHGVAVVVEGYMDVIGPWQAGFRNVVASMGTSLTERHARTLRRYAERIVLAMDPDAAGLRAAERAGELVLGVNSSDEAARAARAASNLTGAVEVDLRVAPLPAGRDPDELTREAPEEWKTAIENAVPFVAFLLDRVVGNERPDSLVEVRRLVERLRPVVTGVRDPIERALYVQRLASRLGVDEQVVSDGLATRQTSTSRSREAPPAPGEERRTAPPAATARITAEQRLMAILVQHPSLRTDVLHLPRDLLSDGLDRELFARWLDGEEPAGDGDPAAERQARYESMRLPPMTDADARLAAQQKIRDVLRERLVQRQRTVTEQLAAAEKEHGVGRVQEIGALVWEGGALPDEVHEIAEAVIESLELGRSMHQWDDG